MDKVTQSFVPSFYKDLKVSGSEMSGYPGVSGGSRPDQRNVVNPPSNYGQNGYPVPQAYQQGGYGGHPQPAPQAYPQPYGQPPAGGAYPPQGAYGAHPPYNGPSPPQNVGYGYPDKGYSAPNNGYNPPHGNFAVPYAGAYQTHAPPATNPYNQQQQFPAPYVPQGYPNQQEFYGQQPPSQYVPNQYYTMQQSAPPQYTPQSQTQSFQQPVYSMPQNYSTNAPAPAQPAMTSTVYQAPPQPQSRDAYSSAGKPVDIYNHSGTDATLLTAEDVRRDVSTLKAAMKGMGTDSKALNSVLGRLTPEQMEQVSQAYKSSYGEDLLKAVSSEVSGNYGELCKALVTNLPLTEAQNIRKAVAGLGTNETLLTEVLCGRTNAEMNAIKAAYQQRYGKTLEATLESELSGDLRRLFVMLVQATRDESVVVGNVMSDVEGLYKAGEGTMGTDEEVFMSVLCNRSIPHLQAVFQQYEQRYGTPFEKVIKKEFSGKLENALLILVKAYRNYYLFVAELFEESMAGLGTNDEMLIRLIVRYRAPRHMSSIKRAFETRYRKALASRVSSEVSGNYGDLLKVIVSSSQ